VGVTGFDAVVGMLVLEESLQPNHPGFAHVVDTVADGVLCCEPVEITGSLHPSQPGVKHVVLEPVLVGSVDVVVIIGAGSAL
jgi:hypothetical protein